MTGRGRFGKYGDLKRKEKIREGRLLRAGHSGTLSSLERVRGTRRRKQGDAKK